MDGNSTPAVVPTLLEQMEKATSIAEFDAIEAGLSELEGRFKDVVYADIQTTEGLARAKADRVQIREVRYSASNKAKAMKDPLNRFKKLIDSQAERIENRVLKVETPIDAQIKAEEARLEAERERKRREKAEKDAALDAKVQSIRDMPAQHAGSSADDIAKALATVSQMEITVAEFDDRAGAAMQAQAAAAAALQAMHTAAVTAEAQAAELALLRAREAERAEQDRKEREAREAKEAAERRAAEEAQRETLRLERERAEQERAQAAAELEAARAELAKLRAAAKPVERDDPCQAAPVAAVHESATEVEPEVVVMQTTDVSRPSDLQLIGAVAHAFGVSGQTALDWLYTVDFHAAQAAL